MLTLFILLSIASPNHGGEPVVIEVEVDSARLYPDEDFLEQATRSEKSRQKNNYLLNQLEGLDMEQRTQFFRDSLLEYKHHYSESLSI